LMAFRRGGVAAERDTGEACFSEERTEVGDSADISSR
jgi:hypothetical protein